MAAQKGIGRKIQFGIAKETTRGTAISAATYWNPWMDLLLENKKELVPDDQAYGVIEDNVNFTETKRHAQGEITGIMTDTTFGLFMLAIFGTDTPSGPADTTVYTHVYTLAQNAQHTSLTLFKHDPLAFVDYSYANAVVEKLELTMEVKKFIQYKASLVSQAGAAQSAFTPATTSENRFVARMLTAYFAMEYQGLIGALTATGTAASTVHVTSLSISTTKLKVGMGVSGSNVQVGSTVASIVSDTAFDLSAATTGTMGSLTFSPVAIALKTAKVTLNPNIEHQDVLGSIGPADFLNKEYNVEGTFEAILQNESDFKTLFEGPTYFSMRLDAKNTDQKIAGAASTYPEMILDFPKVTILEYSTPYKVKDLVYQSIKFRASYSATDTAMVKGKLINAVATY